VSGSVIDQQLLDALIGSDLLELCCFQQLGNLVPARLPPHGALGAAKTGTSGRSATGGGSCIRARVPR
jgi:hypothetical protein